MAIKLFAAIDVGSFELELGIYEVSPKYGIRRVDHVRHVIALGKDTYNNGKITVPSYLCIPLILDKENLDEAVK